MKIHHSAIFVSIGLSIFGSMVVQASPLVLPFNDIFSTNPTLKQERREVDSFMLGRDVDVTSWRSMPLEGSLSEPLEPFSQITNIENLAKRDVYNPPITYPKSGTVWTAGEVVEVKWKVIQADIPPNAKNYKGKVKLGYLPYTNDDNEHLYWDLVDNFPITDESVKFRLPSDLATRSDYIVVLFGDSGNRSQRFTIKAKDVVGQEAKHPTSSKEAPKQLTVNKKVDANTEDMGTTEASAEQSPVKNLLSNVLRSLPPLVKPPPKPCRICLP